MLENPRIRGLLKFLIGSIISGLILIKYLVYKTIDQDIMILVIFFPLVTAIKGLSELLSGQLFTDLHESFEGLSEWKRTILGLIILVGGAFLAFFFVQFCFYFTTGNKWYGW